MRQGKITSVQIGIPIEVDDKTVVLRVVDITDSVTRMRLGDGPWPRDTTQATIVIDGRIVADDELRGGGFDSHGDEYGRQSRALAKANGVGAQPK